jgi:hypothetical protein
MDHVLEGHSHEVLQEELQDRNFLVGCGQRLRLGPQQMLKGLMGL